MQNRKMRVIFVASVAAICAAAGASAQLVNNGWEFLQPVGGSVEIQDAYSSSQPVSDMEFWDPDGPGPHGGFMVVGGAFTVSRAEGEIAYTALIDVSSDQWMPLDPSREVYAAQTSVEVEADGTQSLFVLGGIVSGGQFSQPARAGLFRQGQWTFFGTGYYGTHSGEPDVMTWQLNGERFIVASHRLWLPQFYAWGSWGAFGSSVASLIPPVPGIWTKMMQAIPQASGGVHLVFAMSDDSPSTDGFYRFSGGNAWERIGTVAPMHGAKSFTQRRFDGGADLIAGVRFGAWNDEGVVGRWDGTTWTGLTSSVRYRKIIPYPHPSGAFSVLVTDEHGVSIDGASVAGPALWDGSQWQSLQYPGAIGEVSTAALGPGAPGQQDIYVGGNLRDPVTGLRTVVARLRWQNIRPSRCFRTDFNHNGVTPEIADVAAFFDALAGATPCQFPPCMSLDFNRNGMFPEEQDVVDFLSAYLTDCGP